jgi:DNA-binding LytR/AlgR family response regulator
MKNTKSPFIWAQASVYKRKIFTDSIICIKSEDHKADIYESEKPKPLRVNHTLIQMENKLPKDKFCRCNRRYIINIDEVEQYSEKVSEVILFNGMKIPVEKSQKECLCKLLMIN